MNTSFAPTGSTVIGTYMGVPIRGTVIRARGSYQNTVETTVQLDNDSVTRVLAEGYGAPRETGVAIISTDYSGDAAPARHSNDWLREVHAVDMPAADPWVVRENDRVRSTMGADFLLAQFA
jgi:hypothetical protein